MLSKKPSPKAARAEALARCKQPGTVWHVHWQRDPERGKQASKWDAAELPTFAEAVAFVAAMDEPDRLILVQISRHVTLDGKPPFG